MHPSTFDYLIPTDDQRLRMQVLCQWEQDFLAVIEANVGVGEDRTHAVRLLRTAAMWLNIAITRESDGAPRTDEW